MEPANGRDMVAQFRGELLQDLYGYRYQEVADNFDKYRFGFDGVFLPGMKTSQKKRSPIGMNMTLLIFFS